MSEKKDLREELSQSVHKVWLAGLGALSTAGEEGTKLFKNLVEKGEAYEKRSRERLDDVASEVKAKVEGAADKARGSAESTWDKVESKVDQSVSDALGRFGVPSRDEIATLTKRVEELTAVVEKLKKPAAKKPAAKKPAAKKPAAKATA